MYDWIDVWPRASKKRKKMFKLQTVAAVFDDCCSSDEKENLYQCKHILFQVWQHWDVNAGSYN